MQYGQGMVRPGCWWSKDWDGGRSFDRQYSIATGVYSFHYDIKSFRDRYGWSMEATRDIGSLFVATSPDLSAVWWKPSYRGTSPSIEMMWCPVLSESWETPSDDVRMAEQCGTSLREARLATGALYMGDGRWVN